MSEKVGSGDNASQLLEQEQVLLDWRELPSYDEMSRPAGKEMPQESTQHLSSAMTLAGSAGAETPPEPTQHLGSMEVETEEVAQLAWEQEREERLTAQARGDRLLRAAAESLPEKDEVALLGIKTEAGEDTPNVDTVVMRAEQALGYDQFAGLTGHLLELSYTKDPDEVMREFRSEAQRLGTLDAGDLWEAVLRQAKVDRFGEKNQERKFYYSTSLEDLNRILKSGELVRTDKEGSALKSDLKFSYDQLEDEEWKSGFAEERGAKAQDVTMVFDDGLLDEDTFVAIGKNPSASMVDWRKSCLGLITSEDDYTKVRRIINDCDKKEMPVYLDKLAWGLEAYPASEMRETKEAYAEKMRRARELAKMVYEGGADELIDKHVAEVGARVHEGKLKAFYEKYHDLKDNIQRHDMIEEMVGYYKEIFGVFDPVDVRYKNDEQDIRAAACGWHDGRVRVTVNEAWASNMAVGGAIMTFGHEMCHAYQDLRAEAYANGMVVKDPEQRKYDELCYYNRMDYVGPDMDALLYGEQFVEREAYRFGLAMQEKYGKVVEETERLAERAKRMAEKVGKKIVKLGVGRKRVKDGE